MEFFNEKVLRIANLRSYGATTEEVIASVSAPQDELFLLLAAADMLLSYMPFDMPERTEPAPMTSGEFVAR